MHDIDQVALEESPRAPAYEHEDEDFLEFSGEHEDEDETHETYEHEDEAYEQEDEDELGELGEAAELELAAEFLEVSGEHELEQFIGDLVRSASGAVSDFARTREGRQIGGILKQAAGKVLPVVGRAAGRAVGGAVDRATGGPSGRYARTGAQVGGSLGALAKRCFGLELESASPEDREFEVARRFVRFADDTVRNCLRRLGTGPARQVTRQAAVEAGRRWAPGLVTERVLDAAPLPRWTTTATTTRPTTSPTTPRPTDARRQTTPRPCAHCGAAPLSARGGRWERRGPNTIVLFTR